MYVADVERVVERPHDVFEGAARKVELVLVVVAAYAEDRNARSSQRAFDLRQPRARRFGIVDADDVAQPDPHDGFAGVLFQFGLDVLDRLVAETQHVVVVVGLRIADGHQHEIGVVHRPFFKRKIDTERRGVASRERFRGFVEERISAEIALPGNFVTRRHGDIGVFRRAIALDLIDSLRVRRCAGEAVGDDNPFDGAAFRVGHESVERHALFGLDLLRIVRLLRRFPRAGVRRRIGVGLPAGDCRQERKAQQQKQVIEMTCEFHGVDLDLTFTNWDSAGCLLSATRRSESERGSACRRRRGLRPRNAASCTSCRRR